MQGIGIVAITDELVGDLLRLLASTAEDDPIDIRVVVGDTLQGKILVPSGDDVVVLLPSFFVPTMISLGSCM